MFATLTYSEAKTGLEVHVAPEDTKATFSQATPSAISWASYQIRKIAGAHAPGKPGTFSPPPRVSDPDMHHGTCVTQVP